MAAESQASMNRDRCTKGKGEGAREKERSRNAARDDAVTEVDSKTELHKMLQRPGNNRAAEGKTRCRGCIEGVMEDTVSRWIQLGAKGKPGCANLLASCQAATNHR